MKDSHFEWCVTVISGVVLLILLFLLKSSFDSLEKKKNYIEIQRIDNDKYIQCINDVKYIVSSTSSTVLLDKTGQLEICKVKIYTYNQRYLVENKNKSFISINN